MRSATCGCKWYEDGTSYQCLSHRIQLNLHGATYYKISWDGTQSVTSVDPDSDDPKNVGTKPETKAKRSFKSPEEQEKNTFP